MKIKCVDSTGHGDQLTMGKVYEALPHVFNLHFCIKDDNGLTTEWAAYRFVEMDEEVDVMKAANFVTQQIKAQLSGLIAPDAPKQTRFKL